MLELFLLTMMGTASACALNPTAQTVMVKGSVPNRFILKITRFVLSSADKFDPRGKYARRPIFNVTSIVPAHQKLEPSLEHSGRLPNPIRGKGVRQFVRR